jgi:hypothetical protein
MKYLGVQIDNKLAFKEHLHLIVKKIAKKINFLGRISRKLTALTKTMIYKSIILPHLDYCSQRLGVFLHNSSIKFKNNRRLSTILHFPFSQNVTLKLTYNQNF